MLHTDPHADLIDWQNPVSDDPLNRGLVSWFLAHPERSGGVYWRDLCGRNHGTLVNMDPATDWLGPQGRPGGFGALEFDGSDDLVATGISPDTSIQDSSPFTISLWSYPIDVTQNLVAVGSNVSPQNARFYLAHSSSVWYWGYGSTFKTATGVTATNSVWQNVILVFDGTNISIHRDGGAYSDSGVYSGDGDAPTATLYIGAMNNNGTSQQWFNGQLDDVRIYNRALSASEVADLYNESKAGHPNTLRRVTVPLWTPQAESTSVSGPAIIVKDTTQTIDWQEPVDYSHPLNRGLVSWYLAHPERSGGVYWRDLCGRNHGTLTNMDPKTDWLGPQGRPGGFGALDFDGSNDYVTTSDSPFDFTASSVISGMCWAYPNGAGYEEFFGKTDTANFTGWGFAHFTVADANGIRFSLRNSSGNQLIQDSDVTIPQNAWSHVAFSYDGQNTSSSIKLYINGFAVATTNVTTTLSSSVLNNAPLTLGARQSGTNGNFDGFLDDVRIYNRVLSASEVLELYHESKAGHPNTLRRVVVPLWTPQAAAASAYRIYERYYRQLLAGGMSV